MSESQYSDDVTPDDIETIADLVDDAGDWEFDSFSEARDVLLGFQRHIVSASGADVYDDRINRLIQTQCDRIVRGLRMDDDRLEDEKE